jgi:hypothetical protein
MIHSGRHSAAIKATKRGKEARNEIVLLLAVAVAAVRTTASARSLRCANMLSFLLLVYLLLFSRRRRAYAAEMCAT